MHGLSFHLSVALMHPAKAIGRNEMLFGMDTCVAPKNIVLDRDLSPPWEGEIWGWNLQMSQSNQLPQAVNIFTSIH